MRCPSILPTPVLTALQRMQRIQPDTAVAGGYLRDAMCNVAAKDIDLFCSSLSEDQISQMYRDFPAAKLESFSQCLQYSSGDVAHVYSLGIADGLPLQLIELAKGYTPLDRYEKHDFAICQLLDDGRELYRSNAANLDLSCSYFTLIHCESGTEYDRSMRRWARLKMKYPHHRLVDNFKDQLWSV